MQTETKSIFSPRPTISGHLSYSLDAFIASRLPPAVSKLSLVAGIVLGKVKNIESGACLQSSSIHSMPSTSLTLPISCESQNIVVVPFKSAASA